MLFYFNYALVFVLEVELICIERVVIKYVCFFVILFLDILLSFFFEVREYFNKNKLIIVSDINEVKYEVFIL